MMQSVLCPAGATRGAGGGSCGEVGTPNGIVAGAEDGVRLRGPLGYAATAAENFLMQAAEGMPREQVAWGRLAHDATLRELLTRLCADGAVFLTDHEVRQLVQHNTSWRPLGGRGVLLRHYGVPREELRHPVPEGVTGALLRGGPGDAKAEVSVVEGELRARVNVGEFVVEWTHA